MSEQTVPPGAAILFVAHPGHELCLHGWLERTRAQVFVLTDGSGRTGSSRLASTARVLAKCGADSGSVFGRFSDAAVYRAILERDVEPLAAVVYELAAALRSHDEAYLVADPWELYNPSHDLCRVIATLARTVAAGTAQRPVAGFDYLLTGSKPRATSAYTIDLDDAALGRKLEAADAYTELRAEVAAALERYGADSLRREHLYAIESDGRLESFDTKPYYETFGEGRVAEGSYRTVLRYADHFLPFALDLARAVGVPDALPVQTGSGVS